MPNQILKGSVKYCLGNKLFFIYVFVQFLLFECITNKVGGLLKTTSLIVLLVVLGYGLKVTQDVMNGGTSLPKIKLNELINFGLKGIVVYTFYLTIQASILGLISMKLSFPEFDIEEMILNLPETVSLFYEHDPISFILFIVLGLLTVYGTIFFMEIALARLADGGRLKEAFDFRGIKRSIEVIGWKNYTIDYTKIVLAVVILVFLNGIFKAYGDISIIAGVITDMLAFTVEYRGIGNIYKEYKELADEK
ncbi:hypothetical protein TL18_02505 [Methanobrevibacter sp. YE315]|uniref:DUF4013 domain-containing protein n=1 Tax=Methanobrevibacter sp. YE315 TaxID=1609968 RepID=UPI000764DB8F|nr:DUF4013 domain-containing protein [Methanobrevibacter sp. YE315]AMD16991.1 hypothetical protein TL18_02505 [Methanobrevibacter sp. YE315]